MAPTLCWLLACALTAAQALAVQALAAAPAHPCERVCVKGAPPLTCRYTFRVEAYHSLSKACFDCPRNASDCSRAHCVPAAGVRRSVVVVNRQLPGPPIHVCRGDRIIVDVHNDMPEQSTSIHWHGLLQRSSPYMDGVPQVTQCPIPPLAAFRYNFVAETPGTHMWHSHTGCQRADGAVGVLTVRVPFDPHKALYDADLREHSILLMDWTLRSANDKFAHHFHAGGDNKADTILINGKGSFGRSLSREGDSDVPMPLEEFVVRPDTRYRFRLINAGYLNCPIELSVDNHTLLIIASDGGNLEPVRADVLVSYAGERWDFILETNQAIGAYRIRARGILDCAPKRAHQEAVLRYQGASLADLEPDTRPSYDWVRGGLHVNPLNQPAGGLNSLTAAELRHHVKGVSKVHDPALKPIPDRQLILSYDFFDVDNPTFNVHGLYGINQVSAAEHRTYTPQLNHISMQLPPFPVLPQRDHIAPSMFCNESSLAAQGRDCRRDFCACTHVVAVPLGAVVEVILVDEGERFDANHPFHLHGHAFRVVGVDRFGSSVHVDTIRRLNNAGLLKRNLVDPPLKDTVSVPDGGYAALRVHFNNPGYWLFHCHIDFHVEMGMALIFKVGDHSEMPPVPGGFPQCGNWFGDSEDEIHQTAQESPNKVNKYLDDSVAMAATTITTQANGSIATDENSAGTEDGGFSVTDIPEVGTTEETTGQTILDDVTMGSQYPEGSAAPTSDKSLANLKNWYLLYSNGDLKSKKDKISHNEVHKELITMIKLSSRDGSKDKDGQSSIMRVPPRFQVAVTSDKASISSEQRTREGYAMKEPVVEPVNSEGFAKAEAVNMKLSPVMAAFVLVSTFFLSS